MGCSVATHWGLYLGLKGFFLRVTRGHQGHGGYCWDPPCREAFGYPGVAEQSREGTPSGPLGGWGLGMGRDPVGSGSGRGHSGNGPLGSSSLYSRLPNHLDFLTIRAAHSRCLWGDVFSVSAQSLVEPSRGRCQREGPLFPVVLKGWP